MILLPCRSRGCDYKTTTGNGLSRHRKRCNHYKLEQAAGHAQKALAQQNTLLRIRQARESALVSPYLLMPHAPVPDNGSDENGLRRARRKTPSPTGCRRTAFLAGASTASCQS